MTSLGRRLVGDLTENLCFFTRLPLKAANCAPDFRRIGWAAPIAGAIVGAIGGLALVTARELGFSIAITATAAVGVQILATGALHEDALADFADGVGGGKDSATRLAIMRDSRIGAYGAVALVLALSLRFEALASLIHRSPGFAAAALALAAAAARVGALAPLAWLAPARPDGAGASAAALGVKTMQAPVLALAAVATTLGLLTLELVRALFACAIAALVVRTCVGVAGRKIGGQTGDVCGACAAQAEVAVLLALLIGGPNA